MYIDVWNVVFKVFGVKLKCIFCLVEVLWKCVLKDGIMVVLDLVVDFYNVVSLCYVVLVGGENSVVYCGLLWLVFVDGSEIFDILKEG